MIVRISENIDPVPKILSVLVKLTECLYACRDLEPKAIELNT